MKINGLLVLVLAGFALAAGDPQGFKLWTASDLKAYEKQMAQKLGPTKAATQQLIDFGTHLTMMAYRETDGEAEVHEGVSDVFYVISGDATLVVGGKAIGLKTTGPGELARDLHPRRSVQEARGGRHREHPGQDPASDPRQSRTKGHLLRRKGEGEIDAS